MAEPPITADGPGAGPPLDWWHRDHPTFTALSGFFTGLAYVALVPSLLLAVIGELFGYRAAQDGAPYLLVLLVLPAGLIAVGRTRRFGLYMMFGMVMSVIVVTGVASLVLWILYQRGAP